MLYRRDRNHSVFSHLLQVRSNFVMAWTDMLVRCWSVIRQDGDLVLITS